MVSLRPSEEWVLLNTPQGEKRQRKAGSFVSDDFCDIQDQAARVEQINAGCGWNLAE
jgi:hypothetical protein